MSLSIGIVGLPNVGKSSLFNALTKKAVPAENFPFCTIDPSVGVVEVKDNRLDKLAELSNSAKTIHASVSFVDIAGLVEGASKGAGLGNKFLSHIREVDAIAQVVRIFEDSDIVHVNGQIDPARDIQTINIELILADIETLQNRLEKLDKQIKRGDKEAVALKQVIEKILPALQQESLANEVDLSDEERALAKQLNLLTLKPFMYILNKKHGAPSIFDFADERAERFRKMLDNLNYIEIDIGVENELKDLPQEDKQELRREFDATGDGIDEVIKKAYELLGLISFFTTGEKESRAWTIKKGTTAKKAAGVIHSDFENKFIRAETISWDKLLEAGSKVKAREKGWIRAEGKDYIVQDGDVMEFLHS